MTDSVIEFPSASPSRLVASEIRAELGRQGINQAELARRLHVNEAWVSRRLSARSGVELSFEETARMAEALNVSVQRLVSAWLPRLDSNQQPSGYPLSLVSDPLAEVVYLDERRAS